MSNTCSGPAELAEKRKALAETLIKIADNTDLPVEARNAALDQLTPVLEDATDAERRAQVEADAAESRAVNERAARTVVGTPEKRGTDTEIEWATSFPLTTSIGR